MIRRLAHTALAILAIGFACLPTPGAAQEPGMRPPAAADPLEVVWGSARARLHVVEFLDLGCGACREFHESTFPTLFQEYVESGAVQWTLVPFVSGTFRGSADVTHLLACAVDRSADWLPVVEVLMAGQRTWSRAEDPAAWALEALAAAGFDRGQMETCAAAGALLPRLAENNQQAARLGVRATPTFLVGDFLVPGALPLDVFRDYLDRRLETPAEAGVSAAGVSR